MQSVVSEKPAKAKKRKAFLEAGYALFSQKGIDAVALQDVANASGYGIATLYRYFDTKAGLLLAIAHWKWEEFFQENSRRRPSEGFADKTAADMFDFYLES
ncbi:MAG: helix-turn-helix transcriptional regulator, partial [Eggerthellaceae bacterium]|nr:helix-turn-helix transcriptional regulator [Eggerthellaceae bacterium]